MVHQLAYTPKDFDKHEYTRGELTRRGVSSEPFNPSALAASVDGALQVIAYLDDKWLVPRGLGPVGALAAMGHSGLPFAGALSLVSGLPLVAVRKQGEGTGHSEHAVSGYVPGRMTNYVIVDDLVDSGYTCSRIIAELRGEMPNLRPVGAIVYGYGQYSCSRLIAGHGRLPVLSTPQVLADGWHEQALALLESLVR